MDPFMRHKRALYIQRPTLVADSLNTKRSASADRSRLIDGVVEHRRAGHSLALTAACFVGIRQTNCKRTPGSGCLPNAARLSSRSADCIETTHASLQSKSTAQDDHSGGLSRARNTQSDRAAPHSGRIHHLCSFRCREFTWPWTQKYNLDER
jgi:hypothetical protein